MRIRAQVFDVNVVGTAEDDSLPEVLVNSELTFLMEMSDSVSNTLLAWAADRSTNAAIGNDLQGWQAVDAAAEYWADLFRNWLDRSLGDKAKD